MGLWSDITAGANAAADFLQDAANDAIDAVDPQGTLDEAQAAANDVVDTAQETAEGTAAFADGEAAELPAFYGEAAEFLQTIPEHGPAENAERLVTLLRTGELPPSPLEEAFDDLLEAIEGAEEVLEVPDIGLPEGEVEES